MEYLCKNFYLAMLDTTCYARTELYILYLQQSLVRFIYNIYVLVTLCYELKYEILNRKKLKSSEIKFTNKDKALQYLSSNAYDI